MKYFIILLSVSVFFTACKNKHSKGTTSLQTEDGSSETQADSLRYPGEVHLRNIRQLTYGGDNAEAYFSFSGNHLTFQFTQKDAGVPCDQIYMMPVSGKSHKQLISTGKGRTTCSYFLPGDTLILYSSTHLSGDSCPENPFMKEVNQYVWPVFNSFEIFIADLKGNIVRQLTDNAYYDAEATVSPRGDKIVFTSNRNGDLELYTMNIDGSDVRQITHAPGYDGGAFFSPDGSKIVFRASRPKTEEELDNYRSLLSKGLVAPSKLEIFICNADGSELRQVTHLGKANWAPYFHPSGEKIIFCSNHKSERGFPFNLYMINVDGTRLEQITFDPMFDSFPMFSPDGKQLVFCSNRNNKGTRDTNIFIAEWVD
ncbi:MAG: hypothetical protein KatS3mg031_2666 [Chitinophagales bacterium]|nr:MAG: hypothetical protein KatS3mg031_2666 [Chitinophagales bacterium]